jgi:cation transport ATPase
VLATGDDRATAAAVGARLGATSLSSVSVIANALRLHHARL